MRNSHAPGGGRLDVDINMRNAMMAEDGMMTLDRLEKTWNRPIGGAACKRDNHPLKRAYSISKSKMI